MGASIYWRPIATTRNGLNVGARSSFISALENTFGSLPVELTEADIPRLQAMAHASNESGYTELIDAITRTGGPVEVFAVY